MLELYLLGGILAVVLLGISLIVDKELKQELNETLFMFLPEQTIIITMVATITIFVFSWYSVYHIIKDLYRHFKR